MKTKTLSIIAGAFALGTVALSATANAAVPAGTTTAPAAHSVAKPAQSAAKVNPGTQVAGYFVYRRFCVPVYRSYWYYGQRFTRFLGYRCYYRTIYRYY